MHVVFAIARNFEVNNKINAANAVRKRGKVTRAKCLPWDVEPAAGDVGGDKNAALAGLELVQGGYAFALRHFAVDGYSAEAERAQHDGDALRVAACAAEYNCAAARKFAADVGEVAVFVGEGQEEVLLSQRVHCAVPAAP